MPHLKILLVEDDDANRTTLARLISAQGYEVLAAGTFQEGRRLLVDERPDLLITDVRLGEYNGLQLIVGVAHRTPSIVLTAYADPVIEADTGKAGARFLVKPVSARVLLESIRSMLPESADAADWRPSRRWTRKPVTGAMPAHVNSLPAKVLDVSYGGLRLGMTGATPLPSSFQVRLPTGALALPVELVWQNRTHHGAVECGVAVGTLPQDIVLAWQGLVDTIV